MRASDSPYTMDWFAISIRWLALMGAVVSLVIGDSLFTWPALFILALALWNIGLTILAGVNRRLKFHRQISLGIDIFAAIGFFVSSGGFANPAFWIGVIPLLSSALYFELRGTLITVSILVLAQSLYTFQIGSEVSLLFLIIASTVNIGLAIVFGILGMRVANHIRQFRQGQNDIQEKKHRLQNERLRAIYNLTSTLTATLNYQRVLDSALDLSLSAMNTDPDADPDDNLVSAVLLFNQKQQLEVGSARRLTPADHRVTLTGTDGVIAKAMDEGEPVLVTEIRNDPELSRIVALHSCAQAYCFPLRSGFNVYGILLFGHPKRGYFTNERREILDFLGRQAVIAIQNARLYQDLVEERDRMIEYQEEARKKLARDLHDGPTQSVSAIAMRVNMAQRMLTKDVKAAGDELVRIEDLARRTTKEIRHMLFTLRPLVLESQGLIAAVQSMAEKMRETYGQEVLVQIDERSLQDMEVGKQGVIFYIVEEAVNNARKHARAGHIWVRMRLLEHQIALLEIQDDGVGFDIEMVNKAYDKRGSLGMINLRERTELVNGLLNIQSTPGKGTIVQVFVPLTEEAADRLHHGQRAR